MYPTSLAQAFMRFLSNLRLAFGSQCLWSFLKAFGLKVFWVTVTKVVHSVVSWYIEQRENGHFSSGFADEFVTTLLGWVKRHTIAAAESLISILTDMEIKRISTYLV